ncbi:MAG: universal stress protein [Proteobacteria bacterium]|nr:universal stress protein [Pseudomonadota bacterium]
MFPTAILALDVSEARHTLLDCTPQLLPWGVTRLVLTHVIQIGHTPAPKWGQQEYIGGDFQELAERLRDRLPGVTVEVVVRESHRPSDELLSVARDCAADLIVIGSRSHSMTSSLFLGSFAREVIRRADLPLLVLWLVPTSSPEPGFRSMCEDMLRKVLLATDFSHHASAAERAAEALAQTGAVIDCLHVVQPQMQVTIPRWSAMARAALSDLLDSLHRAGSRGGKAFIAEGEAAEVIARTASEGDHSMIILGKHGQNWIEGRLIGGTAVRVSETATRPVLIAP